MLPSLYRIEFNGVYSPQIEGGELAVRVFRRIREEYPNVSFTLRYFSYFNDAWIKVTV